MRATMPESWVCYFDARFHPPVVTLADLYARGWTRELVQRHLGFTPSVKGVIRCEEIPDVKSARKAFLAAQERARPRETALALSTIQRVKETFRPIEISTDDAVERGWGLNTRLLKEEDPDRDDLQSREEWLNQGHSPDGWHWPAYWIGLCLDEREDALDRLECVSTARTDAIEAEMPDMNGSASVLIGEPLGAFAERASTETGALYARACLAMLDAIDRARRFAAVPGATKWFWCEWTRHWKETRPAKLDPRWGDDDILPPFDRNVVEWPMWPQDLEVTPPTLRR